MVYYYPHFKNKKTEAGGALPKVTQVASVGGGACIQFYLVPKPMLLIIVRISPQDVKGAHLKGKLQTSKRQVVTERNSQTQGDSLADPTEPIAECRSPGAQATAPWDLPAKQTCAE